MGKRQNQHPPGGAGKFRVPQTKRRLEAAPAATGDDGPDATVPALTGDTDGEPASQGQAPGSSGTTGAPGRDGDVAAEQSRAGERGAGPWPQEGSDPGAGGGDTSPAAAAPQPESPPRADVAADETAEDQERMGDAGEEPGAETPTDGGRGDAGNGPERGSGTAGPDPHREEDDHRSQQGGCRGDADRSREPPASALNAEGKEAGAVSEGEAGREPRETGSGEEPPAAGASDAVTNAAQSWGSSAEAPGVRPRSVGPVEGGSAGPGSSASASSADPVPQPRGGNGSPRKTPGDADVGREEAGGGETAAAGTTAVPDPAVPAGSDPPGEGEGEAVVGDPAPVSAATPGTQLSADCGVAESVPGSAATLAPEGTARPAEPPEESGSAAEPQPLPDTKELPALAEGPGLASPRPRAEEPTLPPSPPSGSEDATDIVSGLILELSHLNRLAMSTHRGLEALRRPKPRRSRRPGAGPVPARAGRRWKEL